jgi:hypothetical protein
MAAEGTPLQTPFSIDLIGLSSKHLALLCAVDTFPRGEQAQVGVKDARHACGATVYISIICRI